MRLLPLVAILAFAALWIQPSDPVEAQTGGSPVSMYMRFDGIDGDALEVNHLGWSEVDSINTSVFRPTSTSTLGRVRSRADFEDVIVVKPIDSAGVYLQQSAWTGKAFPTVEIEMVRNGDEGRTVMWSIEMRNVVVTSYSMGTTGQDDLTPNSLPLVATSMHPTEQVTLDFEEATVTYVQGSDDHGAGQEDEVEFDIVGGR
jgi:type VI secretion system secreted protein Hcp